MLGGIDRDSCRVPVPNRGATPPKERQSLKALHDRGQQVMATSCTRLIQGLWGAPLALEGQDLVGF